VAETKEGEGHEHVCSRHLTRYRCTDPKDADLEMGLCPACRAADEAAKPKTARKEKGSKKR
jgi:hypothetical protein